MASQITGVSIICSTVFSGAGQRKHQSSAWLAFVRGIHRWPVDSPHKGPVTRKMFPFDYVIIKTECVDMMGSQQSPSSIEWPFGKSTSETITYDWMASKRSTDYCITGNLQNPAWVWILVTPEEDSFVVRRAGLLLSQQDFEWRWSVPLFQCLTVLEFSFILFDLCLLITFFNFIMNYVPIVTFWIFTYHKIWILSIMFCFIWSYWITYFLACL